jgi:hypothetical protein
MKLRSLLYTSARVLGDAEAIASGSPKKMGKRVVRKVSGRRVNGWLRRLTG